MFFHIHSSIEYFPFENQYSPNSGTITIVVVKYTGPKYSIRFVSTTITLWVIYSRDHRINCKQTEISMKYISMIEVKYIYFKWMQSVLTAVSSRRYFVYNWKSIWVNDVINREDYQKKVSNSGILPWLFRLNIFSIDSTCKYLWLNYHHDDNVVNKNHYSDS